MPQRDHDIYASAPLRGLLAAETAALMPALQRCAGTRALLLSATAQDMPPNLPLLGHWTQLNLAQGQLFGDVRASASEPLPFADDVFDLVLLRHALEAAPMPPQLLNEMIRLLVPGGLLVLTGIHPLSGWAPWWHWHTRGHGMHMNTPLQLGNWLRRAELQVERMQRVGRMWPVASVEVSGASNPWGGGFVLLARKRRRMSLPTRLRPRPVSAPVNAGLAPGARRNSAS
ncbi:MAG: methyltransferase domain-containing protein [Rhodanobacter sp.]